MQISASFSYASLKPKVKINIPPTQISMFLDFLGIPSAYEI
jgi:hypothetical protein